MNRKSVSASLETELLSVFRSLIPSIPVVGFLQTADAGSVKEEALTALQVRVYDFRQSNEATGAFTVAVEIRLNVEQAESANGALFYIAHEKIALWLEHIMLGDACEDLQTDEAYIHGLERTGDDKDFDTTTGEWFTVWNLTLAGCIKPENEETNNE